MVEVKYKDKHDVLENDGRTVAEVRSQYVEEFHLPLKASAYLNHKKIAPADEAATVLEDNDSLVFKKPGNSRIAFLAGALLLAAVVTGSIFAYGFTNASLTINATTQSSNFADVTVNNTLPVTWTVHGMQKGQTGSGTLFSINTLTSGYTGNFMASVSMANLDDLVKVYRSLSLKIQMFDSSNNIVDINADGSANATTDFAVLTLNNSGITLPVTQVAPSVYTIKVVSGSFIANVAKNTWTSGSGAPMLFCEITQR